MKKPLIWLSFITLVSAGSSQAGMLGAEPDKPQSVEKKPSQTQSKVREAFAPPPKAAPSATVEAQQEKAAATKEASATSNTNARRKATSDANEQAIVKKLTSYGVDAKEAQEFLDKTKNMSAQELQDYLNSLKKSLDSGKVQPSDVDRTISRDYKPYAGKPSRSAELSIKEQQNQEAFDSMMEEVLPLSPEQIKQAHKLYDLSLQAKATPPAPPPQPHFISLPVHQEPGSQSPLLRLAPGFVSTILFIDRTGAPWPIEAYSIGDPNNFNIQWDNQSNTMFLQSMKKYAHANMAVRLVGLNTPVTLTLVSGQKDVDFRVDLQMQMRGPEAFPAMIEKSPYSSQVNSEMINVLDGVPPKGSLKLTVNGGPGQAWKYNDKIYYRSKVTLLSPAWLSTVSSPDGTHVYEIMPTPYLLASIDGKTINIKLTGL